jgi:hypothetical protein
VASSCLLVVSALSSPEQSTTTAVILESSNYYLVCKVNSQPCHALSHPHLLLSSAIVLSTSSIVELILSALSTILILLTLDSRLAAHSLHFHTPPQHLVALSNKNDDSDIWSLTHKHTPKNSHQTVALLSFLSLVLVLLSHALNHDSSLLSKRRI